MSKQATARTLKPVTMSEALKASEMTVGQVFEGTLVKATSIKAKDGREFLEYTFLNDNSVEFQVFETKQLTALLSKIRAGSYVKATYTGKKKFPGSPQPAHQFDVQSDYAGKGAFGGIDGAAIAAEHASTENVSAKLGKQIEN